MPTTIAPPATRPIAFRVGRYSATRGDAQLDRQATDTLTLCESQGYEDGGWFGIDDESGNLDTRRKQGKSDEVPTITWAKAKIEEAKLRHPERPVVLVSYKESRLWRDVSEKETVRRWMAQWPDVTIHTFDGVRNPRAANDTLLTSVTAAANQFYSDSVKELQKRAQDERRASGRTAGGHPGFGWRIVEGGDWSIYEPEAALIREAAAEILAGKTSVSILRRWQEGGVPTVNGGQWTLTTFRRIMTKPALAGILVHKGVEIGQGAWPAILDEPTFRMVAKRVVRRRVAGPRAGAALLTGLLFCGRCGAALNSNRKGSSPVTRVYGCRQCGGSNINADAVEQAFEAKLWELLERPDFLSKLSDEQRGEYSRLQVQFQMLMADQEALEEAADELPLAAFMAKGRAIKTHLETVKVALDALDGDGSSHVDRGLVHMRSAWPSMSIDERKAVLAKAVGRTEVTRAPAAGRNATMEQVRSRLRPLGERAGGRF